MLEYVTVTLAVSPGAKEVLLCRVGVDGAAEADRPLKVLIPVSDVGPADIVDRPLVGGTQDRFGKILRILKCA